VIKIKNSVSGETRRDAAPHTPSPLKIAGFSIFLVDR
jgi:hypothetical protein